ncbi:MAG: hypothetical protein J6334_13460, partial [Kiritimatiellae bacterium]|nr:hypothetical protein [Kiritimatiellia bacterium]
FGLSDLQSRGPVDQVGPTWDFRYKVARINPYGGREMEQDARTMNRIGAELGHEVRTALLKEHRYPPKPDMAARMENNRKRDELEAKMQMLRIEDTRLRREIESITERMRGEPPEKITQACERQRKWIKESDKVFREYRKELIRLREEAHTLNLPEEGKRE